jgi:hypothetical protein
MLEVFKNTDSAIVLSVVQGLNKDPVSTHTFNRVRMLLKDATGSVVSDIDSVSQPSPPLHYFTWDQLNETVKGVAVYVIEMFLGRFQDLVDGTYDAFLMVYDNGTPKGVVVMQSKLRVTNLDA